MDNPIWIGSSVDVRHGQDAIKALKSENDAKYWDNTTGIIKIDEGRWKKAQEYELDTWLRHARDAKSDRDIEHAELFDNYKVLPKNLGDVLEIGCGPFTQTRYILSQGYKANSITLSDPLIEHYKQHPNCAYWNLQPSPRLIALPAENLRRLEEFDTIICINVLEHVRDVPAVLRNIKLALRPGGLIIMGERTYDDLNIETLYDIGHPIRVKSVVLEEFKDGMETIYENDGYFIAKRQ